MRDEKRLMRLKEDMSDEITDILAKLNEVEEMINELEEYDLFEDNVDSISQKEWELYNSLEELQHYLDGQEIDDSALPYGPYRPY